MAELARPIDDGAVGPVDIRPMRLTDILDGAVALFRATARTAVPLVLLATVPVQLLSAYLQREALSLGVVGVLDDPAAAAVLFGEGDPSAGVVLGLIVQVLLAPLLSGALVLVMGRRYQGHPVSLPQAVATTARMAGWLVLAYLVGGAVRLAPLVLALPGLLAGAEVLVGLAVGLTVLAVALATPLFALVIPAIMLEPRRPPEAFVHAVRLARRDYARTLGVVVGTTLVINLLALLLSALPNAVAVIGGFGFAWVLAATASVLAQLLGAPLTAAAMVLLHADLRIRREGLDFDVLIPRLRAPTAP